MQWSDHTVGLLRCLLLTFAFDKIVARRLIPNQLSARWFLVHAAFNACVVITSSSDVFNVVMSPLCSLTSRMGNWNPAHFTIAGQPFYHAPTAPVSLRVSS